MLNLYFFFYIQCNLKKFFKNSVGKHKTNFFFFLTILIKLLKQKFYTEKVKILFKWIKHKSRPYIFLKAAFKHKIPKHIIKQNKSKLLINIIIDKKFFYNDLSYLNDIERLATGFINLNSNLSFIPGNLYRIKCCLPITFKDLNLIL